MITNIFGWLFSNTKILLISIIIILITILGIQYNQLQNKNKTIDRLSNNVEYYQESLSKESTQNRTLLFTIDEYKQSKDSLIQQIRQVQEELKIKDKKLNQVQQQQQIIKVDTTIIVNDNNFIREIKPNNLTSLIIIKKDSLLTAKLDIRNSQTLFLTHNREYKNKYKNFFRRLIHFDFKKKTVFNYQIHNSNPIIRIENSRLVEIQ